MNDFGRRIHAGLKVAALSMISNFGAGMDSTRLSHQHTLAMIETMADDVRRLLAGFVASQVLRI